ncbi:MAG TPA: hypothetical protein VMV46_02215 [Thermoanaerobaculia bacterium]|nr:hypothetical protein [Thermoanaerobaculia bacterium]
MTTRAPLLAVLAALAGTCLLAPSALQARSAPCPPDTYTRTPEEVLADHRQALAVGDLDAVDCNYAEDATVISDGGIDFGRQAIKSSLAFFLQVFGGAQPVVIQEISISTLNPRTHMVRLLFVVDTPCVTVPDGVDTYVIQNGQIHAQTSHAFPVFQCLP